LQVISNIILDLQMEQTLRDKIVEFAFSDIQKFKTNNLGSGRRFCNLNDWDIPLSYEVREFAHECWHSLNVPKVHPNVFGNFIGVNSPGAFVHTHKDNRDPLGWHLRINFLIQKPSGGGLPVIDGVVHAVEQGQSWINYADVWNHGTTPVEGANERIVLSLGNHVPEDLALEIHRKVCQKKS
jgi:hypothetical protein